MLVSGQKVVITNNLGVPYTSPTDLPAEAEWYTEDALTPGTYVPITLDQSNNQNGNNIDTTPSWTLLDTIVDAGTGHSHNVYQDDNDDSPSAQLLATDTGGANSVKVIITDSSGNALNDLSQIIGLPTSQWYSDSTPENQEDNGTTVNPITFDTTHDSGGGSGDSNGSTG